jgi:Integrase core domain
VACRHTHGTSGSRPPATRQPQHRPAHSYSQRRSPARTADDARAEQPAADPASASPAFPSLPRSTLLTVPSAHLLIEVLRPPVEFAQYTSITFTERLATIGVSPSIGTVGDAYDNALVESVIGLYKSELINPQRPWKTLEEAEIATLHYIGWFNNNRLYEENGDIPPVELEQAYYRQHRHSA